MRRSAADIRITASSPAEIAERMSVEMYRDAYNHGMGMSAWLERLSPSTADDQRAGYDAFSRVLEASEIYTTTLPEAGIYADRYQDVFEDSPQQRLLGLEWCTRQWKRAKSSRGQFGSGSVGASGTRDFYTSQDYPVGTWMRPYMEAAEPRWTQILPAIPIDQVIALTTPITGRDYRAVYLQGVNPTQKRMVRVAEGTEPPRMKLVLSTHTISLYKYGRILEASYETLRSQRLDRVAMEIALMSIQAEVDKLATIMDVVVNGDGNPATAATNYNLTTLDPTASASSPVPPYNMSVRGWLNFKAQFRNPYQLTTVIVQTGTAVALQMLNIGGTNVMLTQVQQQAGFGGFTAINPSLRDNVALGWDDNAGLPNKVIGLDARRAIERVIETGSNIQEVERHATTQTQDLVLTETEGYDVLDPYATAILTLTA